jgi:hypothetical protein
MTSNFPMDEHHQILRSLSNPKYHAVLAPVCSQQPTFDSASIVGGNWQE